MTKISLLISAFRKTAVSRKTPTQNLLSFCSQFFCCAVEYFYCMVNFLLQSCWIYSLLYQQALLRYILIIQLIPTAIVRRPAYFTTKPDQEWEQLQHLLRWEKVEQQTPEVSYGKIWCVWIKHHLSSKTSIITAMTSRGLFLQSCYHNHLLGFRPTFRGNSIA